MYPNLSHFQAIKLWNVLNNVVHCFTIFITIYTLLQYVILLITIPIKILDLAKLLH